MMTVVLYHLGFSRLRFGLKTALKDEMTSKVNQKKLKASIKRNQMLQLVISSVYLSTVTLSLLQLFIADCLRFAQLFILFADTTTVSAILLLQLEFFRKIYTDHMKKLARQLKMLERQGIIFQTKWAKIKAYVTHSSIYSASVAPEQTSPSPNPAQAGLKTEPAPTQPSHTREDKCETVYVEY